MKRNKFSYQPTGKFRQTRIVVNVRCLTRHKGVILQKNVENFRRLLKTIGMEFTANCLKTYLRTLLLDLINKLTIGK